MFHFYIELLNITETLTLIFTVIGLLLASITILITCKGLKLAYRALDRWKKEKEWDIMIEAKSRIDEAYDYILLKNIDLGSFIVDNFNKSIESNRFSYLAGKLLGRHLELINDKDQNILFLQKKINFSFDKRPNDISIYYDKVVEYMGKFHNDENGKGEILANINIEYGRAVINGELDDFKNKELDNKVLNLFSSLYNVSNAELAELKALGNKAKQVDLSKL